MRVSLPLSLLLLPLAASCALTGTTEGDPLVHLSRSPTSTFFEPTDVVARAEAVYSCTGVASLVVHNPANPNSMQVARTVRFPGSNGRYPRCSHLDLEGDLLAVSSHLDEVQPVPWIALLDVSDPLDPRLLAARNSGGPLYEEVALSGGVMAVAAHQAGVLLFERDGDELVAAGENAELGDVQRVARLGDGWAAGTTDGRLHLLEADLTLRQTVDLGATVMGLHDLEDGRLAVALGLAGIALVAADDGAVLSMVDTNGTALRLDRLGNGDLLVANWSDIRVYDVTDDVPAIRAVDAVFQADDQPRHLAAGAAGSLVYSGEWTGVHALEYRPGVEGPELSPSQLTLAVPEDGAAHQVELDIANEGQLTLTIDELNPPNGWSVAPTSATLEPGEEQTFTLDYQGGTQVLSRPLVVRSNDPDEPRAEVTLRVGSNRLFVGDEAPDFQLTGINTGEPHRLVDQRGSVVVLSYFATF